MTENFYEQQAQEAEQALDKLSDKYNEFIGNVDDARSIVEKFLTDTMYEVPSIKGHKKLVITKEIVDKKGKIDLLKHLEVEDTPALSS